MKAKYRVIYEFGGRIHEFETVIQRNDRVTDDELTASLYPKAVEHVQSLYGDDSFGTRNGFTSLNYEFLGPA